ncbi:aminoglycoside 6'-N-acetyltransferase [Rhizobium sp. BK316]|uniref:GNAT family N-acetyltransferase n=1 Tax=Rhizobium sp. BK316 TaxID=2587053 RepID=UPI00161D263A|nr:GNAT family N-acetyltransferase [Rhizobium sp. BK316]MBB3412240.1 aminoglycoside 6'-N-acetyltransferase [Rhizobium sp. BK316]
MTDYVFRLVTVADLPLLAEWLEQPHVRRWWGEPEKALVSIEEHLRDLTVELYIVTLDDRDFAFIQVADLDDEDDAALNGQPEGTCGIDQFIGIETLLGKGHGPAFMANFCRALFDRGKNRVLVDPHPDNIVAIRAYTKAGFQRLGETTTNYGRALLMALDRQENDRQ